MNSKKGSLPKRNGRLIQTLVTTKWEEGLSEDEIKII